MAVAVSAKNYSLINACEDAAQWTGGTPRDVTDFFKQGTQCVGFELWSSGDLDVYITGSWDLSGTKHFRFWFMTTCLNELNTNANGGVQVYVSDGTNTGYYYVSGSTTYPGGWYNLCIDLSRTVDAGTKPVMTAITTIGLRFNLTAAAKKVQSCWVDHLCICDGLIAYGDDAGGYFDFDDILAADENTSNGWGIIRKISGQYFLVGSIEFGDSAGVSGCKFQAKSSVVVFEDRPVNSVLYAFDAVDNGTGTTEFILGSKAGTAGIEGCVIRVADITQTPKYKIDGGTDTDVDNFKLYGSTFLDAATLKFPNDAANVEVLNCNFESCDEVMATTCVIKNCNFVSANDEAFVLPSGNTHKLEYCNFINNPDAWRIPSTGIYTCSGCKFINNTNDIDNTSGGSVTINKTNLADPVTSTGDTTIQGAVDLTVTVVDEDNVAIQYASVAIYKASDDSQLMNEETDINGIATEVYTGGTPMDIYVRVRESSSGSTRYFPLKTTGTITSGGYTLTAVLIEDLIAVP